MEIKKGSRYVCVRDVYLNGDGEHLYKKGNVYLSERDTCITDELFDKYHAWLGIPEEHFIPYSQLDKVYTKATPLLTDIFDRYEGRKHATCGNIIFFDNVADQETGWFVSTGGLDKEYYRDEGYTYLSESVFIEFMDLGKYVNNEVIQSKEINNFKQITDSLASLLEHKNKNYGNSALEPLKIFSGKSTVGTRIDDKLARVKNSEELRINDVCDILGYLVLICKEKGWNNFDILKD